MNRRLDGHRAGLDVSGRQKLFAAAEVGTPDRGAASLVTLPTSSTCTIQDRRSDVHILWGAMTSSPCVLAEVPKEASIMEHCSGRSLPRRGRGDTATPPHVYLNPIQLIVRVIRLEACVNRRFCCPVDTSLCVTTQQQPQNRTKYNTARSYVALCTVALSVNIHRRVTVNVNSN